MTNKLHQAERSLALLQAGGVANRMMATADGATMAMQQATPGMLAPGVVVRTATKIVAASNASAAMIAQADYVCDGVADEVQINAALASLGSGGGKVLLSEGTFTLAGAITSFGVRATLQGMGMGVTTLAVVTAVGAPAIAAINTVIVQMYSDYDELLDLTIDGNKTGNPSATGMYGLQVTGTGVCVERVRIANSAGYGIVVLATTVNGVVRDCLIEGSVGQGAILRSAAGQPLVVSGCTAKGGSSYGFNCDDGPVSLSDCQALGNASVGFVVGGTALASLTNCTAQSNSYWGFAVSAPNTMLTNCRSLANTDFGFYLNGSRIQLVGCLSSGTTGSGSGFLTDGTATDFLFSGCVADGNPGAGFYHAANGRGLYVGCRATNNTNYGWVVANASEAQIRDCTISGSSHGVYVNGGANHAVDGCRISNIGGFGIYFDANAGDVQITNNLISDVSTSVHAIYYHVFVDGDRAFIYGNMFRGPAAGNRATYAVGLGSPCDGSFIARNDPLGAGVTSDYNVGSGTTRRRPGILALDYVNAADTAAGIATNTWTDVITDQTFAVLGRSSLVQFMVRGSVLFGATSIAAGAHTRLLIDGSITAKLGGQISETGTYYSNALTGGQTFSITGLSVGNHTVRVQIASNAAATWYCRANSFSYQEGLAIQVMEYFR